MSTSPVVHAYTPYPSPQSAPSSHQTLPFPAPEGGPPSPSMHHLTPHHTWPMTSPADVLPRDSFPESKTFPELASTAEPADEARDESTTGLPVTYPTTRTDSRPRAHQAFLALSKRKHFSFILHNLRFIFFGNPSIITTARINLAPIPHLLVVHGIAHEDADGVYEGVAVRFDHSNTSGSLRFVDAHARPPEPWPLLTRHSRLQPGDDRVMVTVPYNANVVAVAVAETSRVSTDARSARALACLRKLYMDGRIVRVCVCGVGVKAELRRLIEGMEARRGVGRAE